MKHRGQSRAKPEVVRRNGQAHDEPHTHQPEIDPSYDKENSACSRRRSGHSNVQPPHHSGADEDNDGLRYTQQPIRHGSTLPGIKWWKKLHRGPRLDQLGCDTKAEEQEEHHQNRQIDETGISMCRCVQFHDSILVQNGRVTSESGPFDRLPLSVRIIRSGLVPRHPRTLLLFQSNRQREVDVEFAFSSLVFHISGSNRSAQ